MKRVAVILFAIASLAPFTGSAGEIDSPHATLERAAKAYNEGDYTTALGLYGDVIRAGYVSPEVFFNAGNAAFRQGDVGRAVLNYRRAWHLAPRDAEVTANLRFAMQAAGAGEPAGNLAAAMLTHLGPREWAIVAIGAYWLSAVLLGMSLFVTSRASALRKAAGVAFAIALLGATGYGTWWTLHHRQEAVIVGSNVSALFAPLTDAKPHFTLPAGSIVRTRETSGEWMRVDTGSESGWIRATDCELVMSEP